MVFYAISYFFFRFKRLAVWVMLLDGQIMKILVETSIISKKDSREFHSDD